jgi:hypothetical protein
LREHGEPAKPAIAIEIMGYRSLCELWCSPPIFLGFRAARSTQGFMLTPALPAKKKTDY